MTWEPLFTDGEPLFREQDDSTEPTFVDACDPECECPGDCPPTGWAEFSWSRSNNCTGTQVVFTDTSETPEGCSYSATSWDFGGGSVISISPDGRTATVSYPSVACPTVSMTNNVLCQGALCSDTKVRDIGNACLCCEDCDFNDLSPSTATVTVVGSLGDNGNAPDGWCAGNIGTFTLTKFLPCQWQGQFNLVNEAIGQCVGWHLDAILGIDCDGNWFGNITISGTGTAQCIATVMQYQFGPVCIGCTGCHTVTFNEGNPNVCDGSVVSVTWCVGEGPPGAGAPALAATHTLEISTQGFAPAPSAITEPDLNGHIFLAPIRIDDDAATSTLLSAQSLSTAGNKYYGWHVTINPEGNIDVDMRQAVVEPGGSSYEHSIARYQSQFVDRLKAGEVVVLGSPTELGPIRSMGVYQSFLLMRAHPIE